MQKVFSLAVFLQYETLTKLPDVARKKVVIVQLLLRVRLSLVLEIEKSQLITITRYGSNGFLSINHTRLKY